MGCTTQTRSCCTELGSPGESPCCSMIALLMLEPFPASMGAVQSSGRRNATDTHLLDVFARAIGRSGPPAVGAPNCAGRAVALAFARGGGVDVLISYLGSEESMPMRSYVDRVCGPEGRSEITCAALPPKGLPLCLRLPTRSTRVETRRVPHPLAPGAQPLPARPSQACPASRVSGGRLAVVRVRRRQ